ncbi:MAG TPA: GspH/FimT family pseudopilin [Acidobacteriota bacterium]|nr:GspH/FimT family pseudopilin [Acidobacteriota bacterium]
MHGMVMFKKKCSGSRGFSLVELSISLAMIALLASFAIPMLSSSLRDMKVISDTQSIATSLTYAKLQAMAQMTSWRLSFDIDDNRWHIERFDRDAGVFVMERAVNTLSDGVSSSGIAFVDESGSAPTGFPAESSSNITFSSRGIPIHAEGPGIVYISNSNRDYAVSVSISGKVDIWRHQHGQWVSH